MMSIPRKENDPTSDLDYLCKLEAELEQAKAHHKRLTRLYNGANDDFVRVSEENGRLEERMKWIAQQHCTQEVSGCDCYNQNLCITEYCYPCYAKQALKAATPQKGE
jgi:hypothetical protein